MPQYKTLAAIATSKGRVPKGAIVELTTKEAAAFGDEYLEPTKEKAENKSFGVNEDPTATQTISGDPVETKATGDDETDPANTDEDDLSAKSNKELKEIAKSLELPTSGTNADLVERITLAKAANAENDPAKTDGE